ncbi:hypothetical protein EES45_17735 [Streptomyces sp. ADI97-07]|nr:hypothetical protein EES45_17735 [Streptomyces sp. ADI97-07]
MPPGSVRWSPRTTRDASQGYAAADTADLPLPDSTVTEEPDASGPGRMPQAAARMSRSRNGPVQPPGEADGTRLCDARPEPAPARPPLRAGAEPKNTGPEPPARREHGKDLREAVPVPAAPGTPAPRKTPLAC